jgi:hypothetical protein
MTFAEYNTDDNFRGDSNAMELVRLGKEEGKTKEEILASLSPLWAEDKKGNVKKAISYHFPETEKPKEEQKAPEPKAKVEATQNAAKAVVQKQKDIKQSDKNYLDQTNAIADDVQETETKKAKASEDDRYNATLDSMERLGKSFRKIDDHFLEQLPRSVFAHYKSGDFGKVGSKEAKQRLAGFIISQFGSSLKTLSNGLMQMGGRSPLFADTTSDWEKFQQTNLGKGMENRWRKYEAETQGAIDLLKKQHTDEQDIKNGIAKIATNNRLQTAFNMMNEKQKAYLINLTEEIGDKIGSFDNEKLVNFMIGAAISDTGLEWQEAAGIAVTKFGKDFADGKFDDKLNDLKEGLGNTTDVTAGVGSAIVDALTNGGKTEKPDLPKPESKPFGKTYEGDTSREGTFWGGKLDDKTMKKYSELQSKKPEGIATDLMSDEEIKAFLDANPDMKGGDVLKKSGINDKITQQAKELKKAVDQAEKDYKATKDFEAYKARVNELNDYFTELEEITRKFGYANFLLNYEGIHKAAKKVNKKQ